MEANRYKAIYFLDAAVNEKYKRDKAKLIVELYELERRFETFKNNNPGIESGFQDNIDNLKERIDGLRKVYDITQELLKLVDGPGILSE